MTRAHLCASRRSHVALFGLMLTGMAPAASDSIRSNPVMRQFGRLFAQPKRLAIVCLALLAALGWIYLGLMLAGMGSGSGTPVPGTLAARIGLSGWSRATFDALCQPTFGMAAISLRTRSK